jgi:SNF2 family DNA or RNA helicase
MGLSDEIKNRINIYTHITWLDRFKTKQVNAENAVLIVDEAHKFKTIISKKADKSIYNKALIKASKQAFKVMLLSATPLENKTAETLNYLTMIDANNQNIKIIKKEIRKENPKFFKCKFSFFRSLKPLDEYPSVREKFVNLDMSEAYKKQYDKVVQNIRVGKFKNLNFEGDQYDEKMQPFYNALRRGVNQISGPSPKIKWVLRKVHRDLKENKKCLIYSSWLGFGIEILEQKFKKYGIIYRKIEGSINSTKRSQYIREYNENLVKVLLITSAGSEGIDLKGTRTVYILEPFWHFSKIEQIIGRAVRYRSHIDLPKKDRTVNIYKLVLKNTLDKYLYDKCKEKYVSISAFYKMLEEQSIENQECY